jgi:peptidoglycan/xylan/chitin deacetylase (PgdA/CDA1 family)
VTHVPVLAYHSVSVDPHPLIARFAVRPATFAAHLDLVVERGLEALTIDELARAFDAGDRARLERAVAITFDDGFADVATQAVPALAERGMPATLYVTTGLLRGGTAGPLDPGLGAHMLDWSDLAGARRAGVQIGAHTHSHPHLDTLGGRRLREELTVPKALLEDSLGAAVTSFAYPHGYGGPRVRRAVRDAGYLSACAVGQAFTAPDEDRLALSRLMPDHRTRPEEVAAWLDRRGAPGPRSRENPRTRGWRAYRRARAIVTGRAGADPGWPAGRLSR